MKGWRTVVTNVVVTVIALLTMATGIDVPAEYVDQIVAGVVALMAVINIFLRTQTDTPIGVSQTGGGFRK